MIRGYPPECFTREWTCYLELHGHDVVAHPGNSATLFSCDKRGQRYRWLLRCEQSDSILLSPTERKEIRGQNRSARKFGESCFLVVSFGHPGGKVIAVPAAQASAMRRLSAEAGGIPWDF
jgi:hypothetical protein